MRSDSVAEELVEFGVLCVEKGVGPAVELLEAAFVTAEADRVEDAGGECLLLGVGSGQVFGSDEAAEEIEELCDFIAVGAGGYFAHDKHGHAGDVDVGVVAGVA